MDSIGSGLLWWPLFGLIAAFFSVVVFPDMARRGRILVGLAVLVLANLNALDWPLELAAFNLIYITASVLFVRRFGATAPSR